MAYGFNNDKSKAKVYTPSDVIPGYTLSNGITPKESVTIAAGHYGVVTFEFENLFPRLNYRYLGVSDFRLNEGLFVMGMAYDESNNKLNMMLYNRTSNSVMVTNFTYVKPTFLKNTSNA